jgi:hypothetical protein
MYSIVQTDSSYRARISAPLHPDLAFVGEHPRGAMLVLRRDPIRVTVPLDLSSVGLVWCIPLVGGRLKVSAAVCADPQIQLSLRFARGSGWSNVSPLFSQLGYHIQLPQGDINVIVSSGYRRFLGPLAACITLKGPEHTITASAGFTDISFSDQQAAVRDRCHYSIRSANGFRFAAWHDNDEEGRNLHVFKFAQSLGTVRLSAAAAYGREKKIWGEVTWQPDSAWRMKASIGYSMPGWVVTSAAMLQYDVRSEAQKKPKNMIS